MEANSDNVSGKLLASLLDRLTAFDERLAMTFSLSAAVSCASDDNKCGSMKYK